MARNDPFLTDVEARADYKSTSPFSGWTRREHLVTREVALLVFVPWICYVLLLLVFALPPPGVFASVFALICWAGTLLAAGTSHDLQKRHGSPFYKLLTLTVLLSCTAGPLAGHHIFVTEMSSYWMHQSGVTYKGVAPSSSPDAYQDAGIIDFSDGSNLDLRRVLGSRPVGSTTWTPLLQSACTSLRQMLTVASPAVALHVAMLLSRLPGLGWCCLPILQVTMRRGGSTFTMLPRRQLRSTDGTFRSGRFLCAGLMMLRLCNPHCSIEVSLRHSSNASWVFALLQ